MGGKRQRRIDINDQSKWGHRFEIRDRSSRNIFSPDLNPKKEIKLPIKRVAPEEKKEPRAKPVVVPKKKRKDDTDFIVKKVVSEILEAVERGNTTLMKLENSTYFNCDLRYFNLDYITEKFGYFDIISIDPPWRIRGGQKNSDSPYMFSNNKFSLDYDTLSNQEIMDIPIEKLCRKGFCFLWVLSGNIIAGYECLQKWGYECVDHLVWVKTNHGGSRAMVSHGFYFLHSTETCLVGYKCPEGETVDFRAKITNDLIISDVRKKSQKPDQLYTVLDMLMPGAKKVEVFARNNNLREGWLSLGNQIGEVFENWKIRMTCDKCKREITAGTVRYKARKQRNFDVCEDCIAAVMEERKDSVLDYFKLENTAQEDILHHYHKCDRCGVEPIWGIRYQCLQCTNIDFCENCYDEIIESETSCFAHIFQALETPQEGHGLPVHHGKRCILCYQKPILGPCFVCADCSHLVLCQNCFFNCSFKEFEKIKGHDSKHKIEIITIAQRNYMLSSCHHCSRSPLISPKYKCQVCVNYELCEDCYGLRETIGNTPSGHTSEHVFTSY